MRVLICTSFSLTKSSAGLNKMNNLIKGLKMQGLETYICGFSEEINDFHGKNYLIKDNKIIRVILEKSVINFLYIMLNIKLFQKYSNFIIIIK